MPDLIRCPTCGKRLGEGRPMGAHLRDAHSMTGMEAHLISNPGDKQAAESRTARVTRRSNGRFDVIEDDHG